MSNLTFLTVAYKNLYQTKFCIQNIKKHYDSNIIIISDGDPNFGKIQGTKLIHDSKNLFGYGKGGVYMHRCLDAYLRTKKRSDYLILIDTDAKVFRPMDNLPDCPAFGVVMFRGIRYLHGSIIGLRHDLVERLHKEKLLLSRRYKDPRRFCNIQMNKRQKKENIPAEDIVLSDCLSRLNIPLFDYQEWFTALIPRHINMLPETERAVRNKDLRYAITHPWKIQD